MTRKYILVIDHLIASIPSAVLKIQKEGRHPNIGIVLLTRNPTKYENFISESPATEIFKTDFEQPEVLGKLIAPLKDNIIAVVCRGDKQIQFLIKTLPFLPPDVLVSDADALSAATNKRLMRDAFSKQYPEITPSFTEINNASSETIDKIEKQLNYPVIVKPADLVSSLLIQSCFNHKELIIALTKIFKNIRDVYSAEDRFKEPEVIVEEYLTGDFYSIDAYVLAPSDVYFCPPVAYVPAKTIGIDDFFLYKRFVPTKLSNDEINEANSVSKKAVYSLGLKYSSAHIELVKTSKGWKIIEIGPRIGRFRQTMYGVGYGIDHSLNDIKIHLGESPIIKTTLEKYCAAYSIYPSREGVLREISRINELQDNPEVVSLAILSQPGDQCRFAKHGGHALAEIVVASDNHKKFLAISEFIEKHVKAVVG